MSDQPTEKVLTEIPEYVKLGRRSPNSPQWKVTTPAEVQKKQNA